MGPACGAGRGAWSAAARCSYTSDVFNVHRCSVIRRSQPPAPGLLQPAVAKDLESKLSHQDQLMKAAGDVIQSQEAEITMLRVDGEATRLRYANLCTRLRELGADEDVTIAAD